MKLRTLATAVALAGTATFAAATAQTATAAPAPRVAVAPAVAHATSGGVQVVRPGQLVNAGHGQYLKLTSTERCVGTPPEDWFTCKSVVDGNQPADTVGVQISAGTTRTLYSPLYIGDGRVARMTLTAEGVTYRVHVVTLAGHPGYATGYVWGAPLTDVPDEFPQITVYDAAGTVLAQS